MATKKEEVVAELPLEGMKEERTTAHTRVGYDYMASERAHLLFLPIVRFRIEWYDLFRYLQVSVLGGTYC